MEGGAVVRTGALGADGAAVAPGDFGADEEAEAKAGRLGDGGAFTARECLEEAGAGGIGLVGAGQADAFVAHAEMNPRRSWILDWGSWIRRPSRGTGSGIGGGRGIGGLREGRAWGAASEIFWGGGADGERDGGVERGGGSGGTAGGGRAGGGRLRTRQLIDSTAGEEERECHAGHWDGERERSAHASDGPSGRAGGHVRRP